MRFAARGDYLVQELAESRRHLSEQNAAQGGRHVSVALTPHPQLQLALADARL